MRKKEEEKEEELKFSSILEPQELSVIFKIS